MSCPGLDLDGVSLERRTPVNSTPGHHARGRYGRKQPLREPHGDRIVLRPYAMWAASQQALGWRAADPSRLRLMPFAREVDVSGGVAHWGVGLGNRRRAAWHMLARRWPGCTDGSGCAHRGAPPPARSRPRRLRAQ